MFHGFGWVLKGAVYLDNFDIYPDAFLFAMPFCIMSSLNSPIQDVHNITLYGARKLGNSPSDQS